MSDANEMERAVQGKVVGVIIPPPEIRAVVDKTAAFVGRNGKSFEQRILSSSEGQTAKFNFMKTYDPYHAYYEMKIKEVEDGKAASTSGLQKQESAGEEKQQQSATAEQHQKNIAASSSSSATDGDGSGTAKESSSKPATTVTTTGAVATAAAGEMATSVSARKASLLNPIAVLAQSNPPEKAPPKLDFIIAHPSAGSALNSSHSGSSNGQGAKNSGSTAAVTTGQNLSNMDKDIIKLTAQFTAVNGREFLSQLAYKEQYNPQFDFLKPTNALFAYFTVLVDSYSLIVRPSAELRAGVAQRMLWKQAMRLAVDRWLWLRAEEERKRNAEKAGEASGLLDAERLANAAIDWMDFVVVETIDFASDELLGAADTAIPTSGVAAGSSAAAAVGTGVKAIPPASTSSALQQKGSSSYFAPQAVLEDDGGGDAAAAGASNRSNAMEAVQEVDNEEFNIVQDYRAAVGSAGYAGGLMGSVGEMNSQTQPQTAVRDPVSGRIIPVAELGEHMRVQLLDPKWREQQERYQNKQRDTGLAEGGSIADNLKIFARKRGDIFGQAATGTGQDSAAAIARQDEEEKRKIQERSEVQWDGHHGSIRTAQKMRADLATKQVLSGNSSSNTGNTGSISVLSASAGIKGIGPTSSIPSFTAPLPPAAPPASHPMASPAPPPPLPSAPMNISAAPVATETLPPPPPPLHTASTVPTAEVMIPPSLAAVPAVPAAAPAPPPPLHTTLPSMYPTTLGILPTAPAATARVPVPVPVPLPPLPTQSDEPLAKKAKIQDSDTDNFLAMTQTAADGAIGAPLLVPDDAFAAQFAANDFRLSELHIQLPSAADGSSSNAPSSWNLNGQQISITDSSKVLVTSTIKSLKEAIFNQIGMPVNKQQLRQYRGAPVLKDTATLAELNIGNGAVLDLSVKSRGGRR